MNSILFAMIISLGANYDGVSNSCPASGNYIMTPTTGTYQASNILNQLAFSSCSLSSIKSLLLSADLNR